MTNVINEFGTTIDFEAAVNLMDDDLREAIIAETEQEFFDAYCAAHFEKFGEEWELAKANPVW